MWVVMCKLIYIFASYRTPKWMSLCLRFKEKKEVICKYHKRILVSGAMERREKHGEIIMKMINLVI